MKRIKRLFIGYDETEAPALHALIQSILANSMDPIAITPILKKQLPYYTREKNSNESSGFSLTRFLVPYMSEYEGWSLYCDCDFVFEEDINKIFDYCNDSYAVMVCKHKYNPVSSKKKIDQNQTKYKMKNWSSLMLFNNSQCKNLSPEYVNNANGLDLHQFKWLESIDEIGSIPIEWNYLVGEENQSDKPVGIHYTNGLCLTNSVEPQFAQLWLKYYENCKLNLKRLKASCDNENNKEIFGRKSIFKIQKKDYVVIPPLFKNSVDAKTDYIQLVESKTNKVFHLKHYSALFRKYEQSIEYIKCQYIGSKIALSLGLITQKCELVEVDENLCLLTEDFRGIDRIYKMDPIAYLSPNLLKIDEHEPKTLLNELNEFIGRDESVQFTKMIIFDLLIGNQFRDAKSIRVIFDNSLKNENEKCVDVLLENHFGATHFIGQSNNKLYSVDLVFAFLKEQNTLLSALSFIDKIKFSEIKKLIDEADMISNEEKGEFNRILQTQLEIINKLKEKINEYYLRSN